MKTKEELNRLKQEFEELTAKLQGLSEDELNMITGGVNRGKDGKITRFYIGDCFKNVNSPNDRYFIDK